MEGERTEEEQEEEEEKKTRTISMIKVRRALLSPVHRIGRDS
jgi:hypothetical protein